MTARGDQLKLIKALKKAKFIVGTTGSGHIEVRGQDGKRVATLAGTCGGGRGGANGMAELARAGFVWRNR
jgi:hypothetical protein